MIRQNKFCKEKKIRLIFPELFYYKLHYLRKGNIKTAFYFLITSKMHIKTTKKINYNLCRPISHISKCHSGNIYNFITRLKCNWNPSELSCIPTQRHLKETIITLLNPAGIAYSFSQHLRTFPSVKYHKLDLVKVAKKTTSSFFPPYALIN